MASFLDDKQLGPAVRRLLGGKDVRCAVAFWGNEAAAQLFSAGVPADIRIICDLSMGGTNPGELEALGAPGSRALKHLPGLHAKVYLSSEGLIACSANASNNGIGFLDQAVLVEAGTFHEAGSETWRQASEWFDRLWSRAKRVDGAGLAAATEAWRRRKRGGRASLARAADPASLLDAVAADAGRFRGVGFVFTVGSSTKEQRDQASAAVIAAKRERRERIRKQERREITQWRVGDLFSEWEPADVSAWPEQFICAHQGPSGRISYWFYLRVHTAVLEGDRGMVMARRPGSLRRKLGFRHGSKTMAATDAPRLEVIFEEVRDGGHQLFESGEKLTELLERLDLLD